jgi:hypothetical protein
VVGTQQALLRAFGSTGPADLRLEFRRLGCPVTYLLPAPISQSIGVLFRVRAQIFLQSQDDPDLACDVGR